MELETRSITELRFIEDAATGPKIVGLIPFNTLSQDLGGYRETIKPSAFTRSLQSKLDVRALFNHDPSHPIGRRSKGTLDLVETERGLEIAIQPNGTSWSRDAVEVIRAGDADGFSFGFVTKEDNWFKDGKTVMRDLLDVDLHEVSVVYDPAYSKGNKISVRALDQVKELSDESWKPSLNMMDLLHRQRVTERTLMC